MNSEDRRVRKTKKALIDAFAHLLTQKPLKNITVREIADMADINRGTFYLHYKDVYDMASQIQNEIFERFNEIIKNYHPKEDNNSLFPVLVDIFNLLKEHSQMSMCLLGKNGDAEFVDTLKRVMHDKCFTDAKQLLSLKDDAEGDYFYNYMVSGSIGILNMWLSGGTKESPEQMALLVENLIIKGSQALKK